MGDFIMLSEKQIEWVREQLAGVKIGGLDAMVIWMSSKDELEKTYKDFWTRTRRFVAFARWASETGRALDRHILSDYADSLTVVAESSKAVYLSWIRCILRRCVAVPESVCAPRKPKRKTVAQVACALAVVQSAETQAKPKRNFTKTFLFELFDIKPGFNELDLKRGYRKAAMQYHPDHGGRAAQFRAVDEAYRWLADHNLAYKVYADMPRCDPGLKCIDAKVKGFYEQIICEQAV